jgi:predicted 2-oxoglutarate/Fe(II)-dependent dioxygenase YbiX
MIAVILALILLVVYLIPTYIKPQVIPDFITDYERKYIMDKARPKLQASTVDKNFRVDPTVRMSETAWLDLDDPVVQNVVRRCLKLTDRPMANCEKLQVLRYKPGGHYSPHQDTFSDTETNKRMYTVILALNDDYSEGETEFPNIGKKYKLKAGDALFFHTLDNYELMTRKALHGGRPVKSGEKWICNLWVHKYPFTS